MTATRRTRGTAWVAAAAALLILVSACSSGGDDGPSSATGGDAGVAKSRVAREDNAAASSDKLGGQFRADADGAMDANDADPAALLAEGVQQQKVISQGTVQLRHDDVGQAIFDVHEVVDLHQGVVEQDATETDDDGDPLRSRMVLRVPSADFEAAMTELGEIGRLVASSSTSEDVTTQVLDNELRVQSQKRSIRRIQVLFDQATSIRDIMSIENELSRRQTNLESLEKQQAHLADQTSMSTITLSIDRPPKQAKPPAEDDHTGFLTGLAAGWDGLQTFAVGLATVLGALLPWLAVLVVLAIPGRPLLRRLRRRQATA